MPGINISRLMPGGPKISLPAPVVATIGNFDGVHPGHDALIERVVALAGPRGTPTVISFYPHPQRVISGRDRLQYLSGLRMKRDLLAARGVRELVLLHFTPVIRELSPQEFIDDVLIRALDVTTLVVGPDAHIGKGRAGSVMVMQQILQERGRQLVVQPFVESSGIVSSRRIRELIIHGDVARAAELLGRAYAIDGRVAHGDSRGAGLGFRTANLLPGCRVLPAYGVYATRFLHQGVALPAVTNVGVRPTFGGGKPVIESHILNFTGPDLYRARVRVEFIARIRDEIKFPTADALRAQIGDDVRAAQEILGRRR